jgi:hypothetical protein
MDTSSKDVSLTYVSSIQSFILVFNRLYVLSTFKLVDSTTLALLVDYKKTKQALENSEKLITLTE